MIGDGWGMKMYFLFRNEPPKGSHVKTTEQVCFPREQNAPAVAPATPYRWCLWSQRSGESQSDLWPGTL